MRKFKEILRLYHEADLKQRQIARSVHVGLGTVNLYLKRAAAADLSWPLPAELDDQALKQRLFPAAAKAGPGNHVDPDFVRLHQELKRKGMTRLLLWEEYRERSPDGYGYTQFCHHYNVWRKCQKRSMRQIHKAGEKLFVDYCGPTVPVVNPDSGEIRQAQVFVATLGASNYSYAEATWSQGLEDWINSHINSFEYMGGIPAIVVPDNLRSGVSKACRYDPDVNPSYLQMARYYHTSIIPARPYKPKDKAKVENAVLVVERWILARLRHHTFFSLAQLNAAIRELLRDLNTRPFQKMPEYSRKSLFESLDKPALQPLALRRYEFTDIKKARVNIDYHIEYDKHYYSVPHRLVGTQVEIHANRGTVVIFHKGKQVANHPRNHRQGVFTTTPQHMPEQHRKHQQWTPGRLMNWAQSIGPEVLTYVRLLLQRRDHPEQGYRACLGLLNLSHNYGSGRLNAACARAIAIGGYRIKNVKNILDKGLECTPIEPKQDSAVCDHENVRGANYYH